MDQELSPTQTKTSASAQTNGHHDIKRSGYLSWDEYFMSTAFLSAMRSKDPSTQVGAVIVNPQKRIVGIGYNGMPRGCSDDALPWGKSSQDPLQNKYMYVCHAEMNAVLNKNSGDIDNCSIYVALFPCNECAKIIIQSGIKEVIYYSDAKREQNRTKASKLLFEMAGVTIRQFVPERSEVVIKFDVFENKLS